MDTRKIIMLSACATALAVPGLSFAASESDPAAGERGYNNYPERSKSAKTRAETLRETDQVRKNTRLWYLLQRGYGQPDNSPGPGKARGQVQNEAAGMTIEERRGGDAAQGR